MFRRSAAGFCAAVASSATSEQLGGIINQKPSNVNMSHIVKMRPQNISWDVAKQYLKSVKPIEYAKLDNGFKVAVEHIKNLEFVTIGIWIDAGSRFETRENNGVAHFLEHMNFKGCKNYTKAQIESVFETLGAHFNAYTSRDRTAYYIKVLNKDVPLVMDLLSDILKNGIHSPRYIELERPTILSEMREVEEIVEEVIMDNLHTAAYDGTQGGLSLTILGPTENIAKHIDRKMIIDYVTTHYTAPRMSMVCSGGLSLDTVHQLAQKHFSDLSPESHRPVLTSKYIGGTATLWNSSMMTAHAHIGFPVCGAANKDVIVLQLLHYFYGSYRREMMPQFIGQGMNAKRPFAADLDKTQFFYTPYQDTGLMGYQLVSVPSDSPEGANSSTLANVFEHLTQTVADFVEKPPTAEALEAAKCAYKASQLLMSDSTTNSAEDLGRQMVHFGRKIPIQEHFEFVDQVTPQQFSTTIAKYFDGVRPAISTAGPHGALPHYDALFERMSRLGKL